jgi:hypothetical protein
VPGAIYDLENVSPPTFPDLKKQCVHESPLLLDLAIPCNQAKDEPRQTRELVEKHASTSCAEPAGAHSEAVCVKSGPWIVPSASGPTELAQKFKALVRFLTNTMMTMINIDVLSAWVGWAGAAEGAAMASADATV